MRCGIYVKVSTDDQRDNGYSIDSQLRMIKEYCEKNSYDIVDVYNDAGHSGKDLMRPEMQRLLKDIKSHKIEVIVAINKIVFTFIFNSLKRKTKQELIKKLIDCIEIKRNKNYDIEITNVKFTEEFISKSSKAYIKYLYEILQNNHIGFIYKEAIDSTDLEKILSKQALNLDIRQIQIWGLRPQSPKIKIRKKE